MRIIGLTGGIASGKSTVSRMLKELGAYIFDADLIAKEAVAPGQCALQEIVKAFGQEVLLPDGSLDRKKLGTMVFSDPEKLAVLNEITHPRVKEKITCGLEALKSCSRNGDMVAVVDAPLLIESGMTEMVDEVWLVAVKEELQVKRVMDRDGLSIEETRRRLAYQMPLKDKLPYADIVIDNNGTLEETYQQVLNLWRGISEKG
ncbi:MAG: dephospho-CoA kinase [Clostridia bacterium]|nr:dephospho-CoA kinase [Clostridia bacterium]